MKYGFGVDLGGTTVKIAYFDENGTMLDKWEMDATKKYAIVFGNEVKGVDQEVIDNSDGCIEIPQYGTKHSLNVSVTAGIVIYQCAERLMK